MPGKPRRQGGEICPNLPSEFHALRYGYHRQCSQRFTNVSRLLKRKKVSSEHLPGPKVAKRCRTEETLSTPSPLLPSDRCLFCDKNRLTKNREEEKLVKCVTKTSEGSIKAAAESKQEETILLKVKGADLVAKEAHYHNSCRKEYTRPSKQRSGTDRGNRLEIEAAHRAAFDHVCDFVGESIISGQNVVRMSTLRERYLQHIQDNTPEFYNPEYKTDKLKDNLKNSFGSSLQFWQPKYKSQLVYSSDIQKGQAVEAAFEIAAFKAKRLEEAALILRREIQRCYKS